MPRTDRPGREFYDLLAKDVVFTRDVARAYDRVSRGYYDFPGDARAYRDHVRRVLKEQDREPGRGLELGAGSFLFGKELVKLGFSMDGVDNSPDMVANYIREEKEGHGQDLVLFQQDCAEMELFGRTYDHAVSHAYFMWIFDRGAREWVLTSYTLGYDRNIDVLKRTVHHLRPGSPFLINAFPHRGDYSQPHTLDLGDGSTYSCEHMDIVGGRVRKHHRITGTEGLEWEGVLVRARFSPRTAESMLKRAGFQIEGFDNKKDPRWYVTRKKLK